MQIVGRIVVLLPYVDAGTIERTFSEHAGEKDLWSAPAATILSHQNIERRAVRRADAVRAPCGCSPQGRTCAAPKVT